MQITYNLDDLIEIVKQKVKSQTDVVVDGVTFSAGVNAGRLTSLDAKVHVHPAGENIDESGTTDASAVTDGNSPQKEVTGESSG